MKVLQPNKRPVDYYNVGDPVRIWFCPEDKTDTGEIPQAKWYRGVVRSGYRHHDGCVSYKLDGLGPQDPELDEDGRPERGFEGYWGCGMSVPIILKEEEYQYFKKHPEEYYTWCEGCYKRNYSGVRLDVAMIPGTEHIFAKMELLKE